jgi:hypothetical protein
MERARVKDWLIGATGMVLILVVACVVFWWVVSDPADQHVELPGSSPTRGTDSPSGDAPPAELRQDELWLADVTLDGTTVVTASSRLRDVRAVGRDVLTGPNGLVATRLAVDATVPFDVVADELGSETTVGPADGGQAMVVRDVEALGRELRVVATGTVEVVGGRLVVEPRSIDFGGPDFLADAVAAVVRELVTIEHDIEGLPEGLVLQDVRVQRDGFRATLRGEDVRLLG